MATEPTKAEIALQEQVDKLTAENKTLKDQAKTNETELKKLRKSDTDNTKAIADLKEKNSSAEEELKASKKEFEDYKAEHENTVKESSDLVIQKRQEVQKMMNSRQLIKEKAKEFVTFLEENLK